MKRGDTLRRMEAQTEEDTQLRALLTLLAPEGRAQPTTEELAGALGVSMERVRQLIEVARERGYISQVWLVSPGSPVDEQHDPWTRDLARQVANVYANSAHEPNLSTLASALGTTEELASKALTAAWKLQYLSSAGGPRVRRQSRERVDKIAALELEILAIVRRWPGTSTTGVSMRIDRSIGTVACVIRQLMHDGKVRRVDGDHLWAVAG